MKPQKTLGLCLILLLGLAVLPGTALAQKPQITSWPSLVQQLDASKVASGSALESLIARNQDFSMLHPAEAKDSLRVPLWLRVIWRKNHPEMEYSIKDPTGGYPLVLKEVHEWMTHHQDLQTAPPDEDMTPAMVKAVSGEKRISGAATNPRSESDIRIDYNNTNNIISASNNIGGNGRQAQYYSTDGGVTWGVTFLPLISGDSFMSDPTVDWTSDGTAWSTTIGINSSGTVLNMLSYKSTNNGATWTFDATFSGSQSSADKQMMWVDHSSTSPHTDNIYVCWHNGAPQYMNRRTSSGWGTPVQVSGSESTGTAIGCDVKSNSFGDVFTMWPTTGNRRMVLAKSTNGGSSWGTPIVVANTFDSFDIGVPSFNNRRILIYASIGTYRTSTKDLVYATWTDLSGDTGCTSAASEPGSNVSSTCKTRVWFTRSTNGGSTWSTPVKINNQAGLNDQYNQWLVVDETNGDLAIMYYDTVGDPGRKKTDVYFQTSTNDGVSWSTTQKITSMMTDETIAGANSGNQYGDYNGMSGYAGVFFPVWTDRRSGGSEEIWTASVTGGAGCTPPSAPTGLSATATSSSQINLSWTGVGGGATYNVYRSTTSGGPYTQIASGLSATSYSNTGLSASTTYYYVVRSFISCESGNSSQASATTQSGGGSCTTSTLYSHNFETGSGLAGWTKSTFGGSSTTSWRGIQTCTAASGSKIFRYGGTRCNRNYSNNNFNYARPPVITVPSGSTTARLSFNHRRQFETGYDGALVALSVDGTNFTVVSASDIISGASYNGTVDAACPPSGAAGLPIFTATQSSFVSTVVNLDTACNAATGGSGGCAGQTLYIAFTTVTDCSATRDGWFLDDVTVTACTP